MQSSGGTDMALRHFLPVNSCKSSTRELTAIQGSAEDDGHPFAPSRQE